MQLCTSGAHKTRNYRHSEFCTCKAAEICGMYSQVSRLCQIRTMLLETGGLSSTNFWAMKALTHILDIDATYRRSPAVSKAANALLAGKAIYRHTAIRSFA